MEYTKFSRGWWLCKSVVPKRDGICVSAMISAAALVNPNTTVRATYLIREPILRKLKINCVAPTMRAKLMARMGRGISRIPCDSLRVVKVSNETTATGPVMRKWELPANAAIMVGKAAAYNPI